MNTTKILIEIQTGGLKEGKFDFTLERATIRFSDCFTSSGANVQSCTATLLPSDESDDDLAVRNDIPPQRVEDAV
jgi:hypothetical protein